MMKWLRKFRGGVLPKREGKEPGLTLICHDNDRGEASTDRDLWEIFWLDSDDFPEPVDVTLNTVGNKNL